LGHAGAVPIKAAVLAERAGILGAYHPAAPNARRSLAASDRSVGRTAEAISIQEAVVADFERILGPDHPDTLTIRANLVDSYRSVAEAICQEENPGPARIP